ncbi:MAG: gamma-glutamyl-gamma-aminobutyrate hydrolase family protein [Rhodoglobus sp.]
MGTHSRPLIGLTTYLEQAQTGVWDVPASFLPKIYIDAVTAAGAVVVLLPPQPVDSDSAASIIRSLDGLILTGGKDVDPAKYGQQPHSTTDVPRKDRDAFEDALLRAAIEQNVPFLGICRGAQMLNVVLGGTIHQHLPDVIGSGRYSAGGGIFLVNDVSVTPDTTLSALLGGDDTIAVKSYHHQAIDRLADGLIVSARADDGIIQAVELPSVDFGVAVQWHPEEDATTDARLFDGIVAAARRKNLTTRAHLSR